MTEKKKIIDLQDIYNTFVLPQINEHKKIINNEFFILSNIITFNKIDISKLSQQSTKNIEYITKQKKSFLKTIANFFDNIIILYYLLNSDDRNELLFYIKIILTLFDNDIIKTKNGTTLSSLYYTAFNNIESQMKEDFEKNNYEFINKSINFQGFNSHEINNIYMIITKGRFDKVFGTTYIKNICDSFQLQEYYDMIKIPFDNTSVGLNNLKLIGTIVLINMGKYDDCITNHYFTSENKKKESIRIILRFTEVALKIHQQLFGLDKINGFINLQSMAAILNIKKINNEGIEKSLSFNDTKGILTVSLPPSPLPFNNPPLLPSQKVILPHLSLNKKKSTSKSRQGSTTSPESSTDLSSLSSTSKLRRGSTSTTDLSSLASTYASSLPSTINSRRVSSLDDYTSLSVIEDRAINDERDKSIYRNVADKSTLQHELKPIIQHTEMIKNDLKEFKKALHYYKPKKPLKQLKNTQSFGHYFLCGDWYIKNGRYVIQFCDKCRYQLQRRIQFHARRK